MDSNKRLERLNLTSKDTLMETLQIEYTEIGEDYLVAKMPVTPKVHQPDGVLHGGATAALAETVGSLASILFIDNEKQFVRGMELSINHLKSISSGYVYATAKAIHRGRTTHLWEIKIVDDNDKLISIAKLSTIVLNKK